MALVMPVETRLWQLVGEIEAIASEVSDAALTAAARRLELLVARDEPARSRAQRHPGGAGDGANLCGADGRMQRVQRVRCAYSLQVWTSRFTVARPCRPLRGMSGPVSE